jgi:hypothetical protein
MKWAFWTIVALLMLIGWLKKPPIPLTGGDGKKVTYASEPTKWISMMSIATALILALAVVDLSR